MPEPMSIIFTIVERGKGAATIKLFTRNQVYLHDLGPEVAHSGGSASVFGSCLGVAGPVHVRPALYFIYPQGVDDDVDVDVAAVVVSVRVGADQGLVFGELLGTEPLPQRLSLVHCQAVIGAIPGVKAENVVMAFYVLSLLVLTIAEIGPHTGHGEVLPAAVEGGDSVVFAGDKPPTFVQNGLAGELVMLKK